MKRLPKVMRADNWTPDAAAAGCCGADRPARVWNIWALRGGKRTLADWSYSEAEAHKKFAAKQNDKAAARLGFTYDLTEEDNTGAGADAPKPGATLNPKALRPRALKAKAGYFWTVFPDANEAWRWWRFNPADEMELASDPFPNRGAAELDVIKDFHRFTPPPAAPELEVKQGKPSKRPGAMAMTVYARCPQGAGALKQGERGMNWNKLAGGVKRAEKAHAKAERAVYVALAKLGKALVKHGRGKRDCNIATLTEAKALEAARKEVRRLAQAHKEAAAALK